MNPKKIIEIATKAFPFGLTMLTYGKPGIGKTQVWQQVADKLGWNLWTAHPAISDPTDFKGMPMADGNICRFMPDAHLMELVSATAPTLSSYEDIGQATPSTQAALMPVLGDRRINGYKVSDQVVECGTTNEQGQMAGVNGMLEPLKDRWDCVIPYEITGDDWIEWAMNHDDVQARNPNPVPIKRVSTKIPEWLIAALHPTSPCCTMKVGPKGKERDEHMVNAWEPNRAFTRTPTARAIGKLAKWDNAGIEDREVWSGIIGDGAAAKLIAFKRQALSNLPAFTDITIAPDTCPVPNEAWYRYAVSVMCARNADRSSFGKALRYIGRMNDKAFETLLCVGAYNQFIERRKTITDKSELSKWNVSQSIEYIKWVKDNMGDMSTVNMGEQ